MNDLKWIDTHAHLTHKKLQGQIPTLLENCRSQNICQIISAATTACDAEELVQLCQMQDLVKAAVGIHPNDTHLAGPNDWTTICRLVQEPSVVAIGETGLDRYWKDAPLETQIDFFERHLELALEYDLPVVIHCRDAMEDILSLLEKRGKTVRGTLHCFIGSLEDAKRLIDLGLHMGIGGISTFRNKEFDSLRETIQQIPIDRLLVETDAPFLSPHPFRGKVNEPARVSVIGEALAELLGISIAECASITSSNAQNLFRISC